MHIISLLFSYRNNSVQQTTFMVIFERFCCLLFILKPVIECPGFPYLLNRLSAVRDEQCLRDKLEKL